MNALRRKGSSRRSRRVPKNVSVEDPGLSQKYYTRRHSSQISTRDLPLEFGALGFKSGWTYLWYSLFFVAPLAYIYIGMMLLRDLCEHFPETIQQPLQYYVPFLANLTQLMKSYYGFRLVDVWCVIEALFFIACRLKMRYLQSRDPLEASLSAAPMLDAEERRMLWDHMMEADADFSWVTEWFLDHPPIESISRYDIFDFICWAMFDGRNQEHLTTQELQDLEAFVEDLEYRISLQLYGEETGSTSNLADQVLLEADEEDESDDNDGDDDDNENSTRPDGQRDRLNSDAATANVSFSNHDDNSQVFGTPLRHRHVSVDEGSNSGSASGTDWSSYLSSKRPRPRQTFRFREDVEREQPNFFSNLYESYKQRYERYRTMVENADFRPMQDIRNLVAETAQQAAKTAQSAEETAMKSAQNVYETIIQPGSNMDKQLSALGHATTVQLSEAWNSVKGMKERLETANFLAERRKALMQQLRGNRAMLTRMREMSYAVNSKQMAALMRRITECYEALERTEVRARDAFLSATGKLTDNSLFGPQEPKRYAKYSSDPLLGIATYPLGFHLLMLSATEIPLRVLLRRRGFERRCVGPVSYYFHPGREKRVAEKIFDDVFGLPPRDSKKVPNVFVHGIGVGLIAYIPLIDAMLETGRPLLLPEIPYVSSFRPWQSPNSVLSPAVVASTMTAILAYHGFAKGTFVGHSYGTSWLSYVCKYTPGVVAGLLFLDPICFCLHNPRLTTSFVYHRPDPGGIAFTVRTDMMVNWTIQRAFPWAWISLFLDQIHVPCTIFLSDKDALVPSEKVEEYLRNNNVPIADAQSLKDGFFDADGDMKAFVWREGYHGIFTDQPHLIGDIAAACTSLCNKVEERESR